MRVLGSIARRCLRGRAFTRLLESCGIEPRRYWLLVDLFQTLGNRGEVARMGNQDYSLRFLVIFWFFLASLISLAMAFTGTAPEWYLLLFLGITVFNLSILLIPEAAETLVNPVEGLILAHQPVNGATWSAAKLTHLVRAVVYVVAGVNGVPALVGLILPHGEGTGWLVYPLAHLLIALGAGMVFALLCCSLFGWLIRFVPVRRLKAAAGLVQVVPMLLLFGFQILLRLWRDLVDWSGSVELFQRWLAAVGALSDGFPVFLGVAGGVVGLVAILQGLRALSADHLIRVSGLMHSGSRVRWLKRKGSRVGPWVARVGGGQACRAGYEYLHSLMLRDWQFLRNAAPVLLVLILSFCFVLASAGLASPFGPEFALIHFLPHLLGLLMISICRFLAYGNDFKATAWFFTAPDSSFRPFAGGIHAALWLLLAALPNLLSLPVLAWFWPMPDVLLFVSFSMAVTSLYLGVGLRLIDGVPFGKQAVPTRGAADFVLMMVYLMAAGIAVGIQYLLFRSTLAVVLVTLIVGAGARFLTRAVLDDYAARIRLQLQRAASGSVLLYKEVE
ncbi:MAG: hypothetical protein OXI69_00030 [Acidobacteriota bacterium]|nr:hypothetical protein [Acidobacteriota bacterium]